MKIFLQLFSIAIIPVIVSAALYLLNKRTKLGKLKDTTKQLIFGVIFGLLAIMGTEFGVDVGGATANTRDASVLISGLVFGPISGIISGLIGGFERWFAVLWGAGTYTRLACSLSTIFAGFIGAGLRKFLFDNKKPSWLYALAIGIVTEDLHMLMIFFTNMSDIHTAFTFVEKCSLPMITVNAASVMLALIVVTKLGKEKRKSAKQQISTVFQRWLLVCVMIAFVVTCAFMLSLQNNISQNDTNSILSLNLSDVKSDISDASDKNLLEITHKVADEIDESGSDNANLSDIAQKHNIEEIDIIDKSGAIKYSTNQSFVGYNMANGKQSKEFLALLNGSTELVQKYQPISYDKSISRKYAGVTLKNGGFVQVGYDADNFQNDIADEVNGITKNRHIGNNGCVIIADKNKKIVSDSSKHNGQTLEKIGVKITSTLTEDDRFEATVHGVKSYCMYEICESYYVVSVIPEDEALFSRNISVYVIIFLEIVVFVGLFVLIYYLIKKLFVNNINKINGSLNEITNGNLEVMVNVRTMKNLPHFLMT